MRQSVQRQVNVASALNTDITIFVRFCRIPIGIGTPTGKVLVKCSRMIKHAYLSLRIKVEVEKGGESRMRYNSCCLKSNIQLRGHSVLDHL